MNKELILCNLEICAQHLEADKKPEFAETALIIADMLIAEAVEVLKEETFREEQLPAYISGLKTASSADRFLSNADNKLEGQNISEKVRGRISELAGKTEALQTEQKRLEQEYTELLKQEDELLNSQNNLLNKKAEIDKLLNLRDKELGELKHSIKTAQEKLAQLDKNVKEAKEYLNKVNSEINEVMQIIQKMPESCGIESVDELIKETKKAREECNEIFERTTALINSMLDNLQSFYVKAEERQLDNQQ